MKFIDYIIIVYILVFVPFVSIKVHSMVNANSSIIQESIVYPYSEDAVVYVGQDRLELEVTYCSDSIEINSIKSEIVDDYIFVGSYEDVESIISLCFMNEPTDSSVVYLRNYYKNIVITTLNNQ